MVLYEYYISWESFKTVLKIHLRERETPEYMLIKEFQMNRNTKRTSIKYGVTNNAILMQLCLVKHTWQTNIWSCTKDKCFHYRSILRITKGSTIIHITLFHVSRFFLLMLFHLSFYRASSSTMLKTILFTENDFCINFIANYCTK